MPVPNQRKSKKKESNPEDVLLVAQEIKFARVLAGNEKRSRDKILKTLKKWFTARFDKGHVFKEDDFARIWKGLFYAVWMSDKPLIQEELCDSIAGVLDLFPEKEYQHAAMFFKVGLKCLSTEWYGIDQHRIDKFLMLVRRFLRGAFRYIGKCGWSDKVAAAFCEALGAKGCLFDPAAPQHVKNALAMQLHIVDCYLEEIAKMSKETITNSALATLIKPLATYMALGEEKRLCGSIKKNIFSYIFRQSEMGQEYDERRQAWIRMGCPPGGPEAMEKVDESDSETGNNGTILESDSDGDSSDSDSKPLDPRAGRVDVVLSVLPVPAQELIEIMQPLAIHKKTSVANRHRVRNCIHLLSEFARGHYPLRARTGAAGSLAEGAGTSRRALRQPRAASAARRLASFESALLQPALRGLSRKQKKRLLSKSSEVGLQEEEKDSEPPSKKKKKDKNKSIKPGEWQVEDTEPIQKIKSQSAMSSEKENLVNGKNKKSKPNKRKNLPTSLLDEIPLKKLKNTLLKEKGKQNVKDSQIEKKSKVLVGKKTLANRVNKNGRNKILNNFEKKTSKNNNRMALKPKLLRSLQKSIADTKNLRSHDAQKPKFNSHDKSDKTTLNKNLMNNVAQEKTTFARKNNDKVLPISLQAKTPLKSTKNENLSTPKKVKFLLKNISAQAPIDYYKSVRKSPNIPFEPTKKPTKTNLKPSTPSPINPFFKKKLKLKY